MSRDRRNTQFFYFLLAALLLSMYIGISFVTTVDKCGDTVQKKWEWVPPHWECLPRIR